MSEATASQEPSMEEILASIRRIISEEGQEQPGGDALAPLAAPMEVAPKPQPPRPAPQPVPQPMPAIAEEDDDDELVLTEVVTASADVMQNNVVPLKPEARFEPEPDAFAAAKFETEPGIDLIASQQSGGEEIEDDIELALDEPVAADDLTPGGSPVEPMRIDPIPEAVQVEPVRAEANKKAEKPAPEARGWAEPQPTPTASRKADEFTRMTEEIPDLVAPEVANAATASFAQLLQPSRRPADTQDRPTGDGLLVETLVRLAVEPMLKAWLDTHLEPIVERIVRREVERMARKAELS